MEEKLPKRKQNRLRDYDYSTPAAYFITICTKERRQILSRIVGTGVLDGPSGAWAISVALSERGKIAEGVLRQISDFYENISLDAYVIMPDHIHFLLQIKAPKSGPSGTPVPTSARRGTPCEGGHEGGPTQNSTLSRFVSTFKRFCNKAYGENIWQSRSYDHVIRDASDYEKHVKYIAENPMRRYYAELGE